MLAPAMELDVSITRISSRGRSVDAAAGAPATYGKAVPADVFSNGVVFYHLLALMDTMRHAATNPAHPYDIPSSGSRVSPVHVLTVAVFNLYYLYSVELKMGLAPDTAFSPPLRDGIKPTDVFREYDRNNFRLMGIVGQLGGATP